MDEPVGGGRVTAEEEGDGDGDGDGEGEGVGEGEREGEADEPPKTPLLTDIFDLSPPVNSPDAASPNSS